MILAEQQMENNRQRYVLYFGPGLAELYYKGNDIQAEEAFFSKS
jgi:hypothetical protein